MKAILFTQEDTVGFNALQERIHLHMLTKIGVDGFHYSADCWASVESAYVYEDQLCMPVNEYEPVRYGYLLEVSINTRRKRFNCRCSCRTCN
jgi:hypothetical protein